MPIYLLILFTFFTGAAFAKTQKTSDEIKLAQTWMQTGVTENDLKKLLSNDNCYRDVDVFSACIRGINNIYTNFEKEKLSFVPEDLIKNFQQLKKLMQFGYFWVVEGDLTKVPGRTLKAVVEAFKQLFNVMSATEKRSFANKNINFELILRDVLARAKAEKMHIALLYANFMENYLSFIDQYQRLVPTAFIKYQESKNQDISNTPFSFMLSQGHVIVDRVLTPEARKTGLRQGDEIIAINENSLIDKELFDILKLLEKIDEQPRLKIKFKRNGNEQEIRFLRSTYIAKTLSISEFSFNNTLTVYVRLNEFRNKSHCREIAEKAATMANKTKNLIFDLRDNPGGLRELEFCLAGLFLGINKSLGKDTVEQSTSYDKMGLKPGQKADRLLALLSSLNIVILQNKSSASASESLAGNLQFHQRALIVGQTSWGKGSMQTGSFADLQGKVALLSTETIFFLANNKSPDYVGITPDFKVPWRLGGDNDEELEINNTEIALMQGNRPKPQNLPFGPVNLSRNERISKCINHEALRKAHESEFGSEKGFDYQKAFAAEVLRCM